MEKNQHLSRIFEEMAELTRFLEGSDSFRASAYQNAKEALNDLERDLGEFQNEKELTRIEGIGKSIAAKISEYLETGGIKKLDELRNKVPEDLIPLMKVKGLGPKTLRKFYDDLGIVDRQGLEKALNDGSVEALEGFGAKRAEKILRGLEMHDQVKERILLPDALRLGERLLERMRGLNGVERIELAGSLRRRKSTVGDIDILIAAEEKEHSELHRSFVGLDEVEETIAHGESKSSIQVKELDRQIDLRTVTPDQWGAALHYFTGSQAHNVRMRSIAGQNGWKVNEYGVFDETSGERIAGESEEELYRAFNMDWIPPELREDRGEMEAALEGTLPELIELEDLKGDLHMHSNYSDGRHSLEEIAHHILEERGDAYFAITDHSKAVGVAGGMDDDGFLEQMKAVEKLKKEYGDERILMGAEVDILADGRLDLADSTLEGMDWVVASVHTGMDRDNTERIIKACESPFVNAIGHPTGRLLGSRQAYELDFEKVLEAAASTGTALEINAQPQRMDLDDELALKAKRRGIPLVIDTDMHRLTHLEHAMNGIAVARRAWCTKADILNALNPEQIRELVQAKRTGSLSKA